MNTFSNKLLGEYISLLFLDNPQKAVELLEGTANDKPGPDFKGLLRMAALLHGQSQLYYYRVFNLWTNIGRPPLKPNATARRIVLLTDFTADNLVPFTSVFCASYGVDVEVSISAFDSVEQQVLDRNSSLEIKESDIVVLIFSEHWLKRYLDGSCLVDKGSLDQLKQVYTGILEAILSRKPASVLLSNFPSRAYPMPSGTVRLESSMGWNSATINLNDWISGLQNSKVHLLDLAGAISSAGGMSTLGRLSYLRARMAFEPAGNLAVSRELATAVASLCGKTHRALITDWDNTLWGGILGEVGMHGIISGPDSPDGLGYYMVQEYIKGLKSLGILLGASSKNDPVAQDVFKDNSGNLALELDDFDSLQVGWHPKSDSVTRVAEELGFGEEYMVFLDDSLFELTEVFADHPYIDLLLAGPDPESTLRTLSESRFFNSVSLSRTDLERSKSARSLRKQREYRASFKSLEDFLRNINIILKVTSLDQTNLNRVVQMFQKTNQFNLTTRRHGESELRKMGVAGADIAVFSYEDTFGTQGIICVVVLLPKENVIHIESWLMSCRVLNRTIEQAVFCWIVNKYPGKIITGEFIPTEKNGLVRSLYQELGFKRVSQEPNKHSEIWRYTPQEPGKGLPEHFAEILSG